MKRIAKIIILLLVIGLGWWGGRSLFMNLLYSKMEEQLYRLRDAGYVVSYDSIKIDWTHNTVEVFRLKVQRDLDSTRCSADDFLSAKYIKADGFSVSQLILRRHLDMKELRFDSARLLIHDDFLNKDTVTRRRTDFSISIDKVAMPKLVLAQSGKVDCTELARFSGNMNVSGFSLTIDEETPPHIDFERAETDSVILLATKAQYMYKIRRLDINLEKQTLHLDTLRIIPIYKKYEFAQKKGFQTDRFEGIVPYVNLYGLSLHTIDSLGITARKMTTQLFLHAFRDKRIEFREEYKPLPMEQLAQLDVGIKIDSVVLNNSKVVYEEFAEEADSSGYFGVTDLYALIRNVDNTDPGSKGETVLLAESKFMEQGAVKLRAIFPHDYRKPHRVSGSVSDMKMNVVNPMIEPIVHMRAESGHIQQVNFSFTGDSHRSKGEIDLKYTGLKLVSLKSKEKRKKHKKGIFKHFHNNDLKDGFTTFLINTFIVKKDMDKNTPDEKRKGEIDFERNKSKYIFNYWWKSVASGLKSAYKIDKLEESKFLEALRKDDK